MGWLTRACFLENGNIGHQKDRVFTAGGGGRGRRWWFAGCSSGGALVEDLGNHVGKAVEKALREEKFWLVCE